MALTLRQLDHDEYLASPIAGYSVDPSKEQQAFQQQCYTSQLLLKQQHAFQLLLKQKAAFDELLERQTDYQLELERERDRLNGQVYIVSSPVIYFDNSLSGLGKPSASRRSRLSHSNMR